MTVFCRFEKTIFLFLFMTPFSVLASCMEADVEKLIQDNFTPRIQFLKQEKLWGTFQKATEKKEKHLMMVYEQKDWDSACRGIREYIEIADDILAGGDGQTQPLKTPWKKCTPEKFLVLEKNFQSLCLLQPNNKCAREELVPLTRKLTSLVSGQSGPQALKPADYMDQLCETMTGIITLVNE